MKLTPKQKIQKALFYTIFDIGVFLYILTIIFGIDACIENNMIKLIETIELFGIGTIFMLISLFLTKWS